MKTPRILCLTLILCAWVAACHAAGENTTITAIPGIRVGHYEDRGALRGVTVIRFSSGKGAVASVDVRGSAPGTRETDLLDPINMVKEIHAIVLAGETQSLPSRCRKEISP